MRRETSDLRFETACAVTIQVYKYASVCNWPVRSGQWSIAIAARIRDKLYAERGRAAVRRLYVWYWYDTTTHRRDFGIFLREHQPQQERPARCQQAHCAGVRLLSRGLLAAAVSVCVCADRPENTEQFVVATALKQTAE